MASAVQYFYNNEKNLYVRFENESSLILFEQALEAYRKAYETFQYWDDLTPNQKVFHTLQEIKRFVNFISVENRHYGITLKDGETIQSFINYIDDIQVE